MGRSPCCDKVGLKKGPWTPEEDQKLLAYIEEHGHGSWRALPVKAGLQRCGKSCRLRWTNYLRPDIKRGKFSLQEEQTIIQLHALLGNRWSAIATHLPKRTDNEIKNYWNTHLKKRLAKMGIDPLTHKPKNDALFSGDGQCNKSAANLSHMAQWESARLEAEARLARQSKLLSASSIQAQASQELTSTSTVGPTRCLDVLKAAWSGGAGPEWSAAASGDMESPTSTLSSSAANASSSNLTDLAGNNPMLITSAAAAAFHDASFMEKFADDDEDGEDASFMETFTDLLLSANGKNDRCGEEEDVLLHQSHGEDGSGRVSVGGCFEDGGKNYWDSILDLVNSSPSHDHSNEF